MATALYNLPSDRKILLSLGLAICTLLSVWVVYKTRYNDVSILPETGESRVKISRPSSRIFIARITESPQVEPEGNLDLPSIYADSYSKAFLNNLELLNQAKRPNARIKSSFHWLFDDNSTIIYSAHYDRRDATIKFVGFKHRNIVPPDVDLLCDFHNGKLSQFATYYNVSVNLPRPGLQYDTWLWQCSVPDHHVAQKVTIRASNTSSSLTLDVSNQVWENGPEASPNLLICVKPMVNNYSNIYQLREFVEISQLLGASKIVLYLSEVHNSILPTVSEYVKQGIVDIHWWKPPVPMNALHAFGQKSHNHHCLYTYMYQYGWAAFIDLDEIIVPSLGITNYGLMLTSALRKKSMNKTAAFIVRSRMCSTAVGDDPLYETDSKLCRAIALRKTNCTDPMPIGDWSKPIVKMIDTYVVDIHTVRQLMPGYMTEELDTSLGAIHHYRDVERDWLLYTTFSGNKLNRNLHQFLTQISQRLGPEYCSLRS